MNDTLSRIVDLVQNGDVRVSAHGYDEMAEDGILAREVVDGAETAVMVEDYPEYAKGPCVLVTAYRPDPVRWTDNFLRRKP
jgi:hypothetical protein